MSDPVSLTPEVYAAIAVAVRENAQRLGLKWRLLPATVTEALTQTDARVRLDGDPASAPSVPVLSLIGALSVGQRVMTMHVPPQGVYVVGGYSRPSPGTTLTHGNVSVSSGAGSTGLTTYTDYPGSPTVPFIKLYGATESDLLVRFAPGYRVDNFDSGPSFAVRIGGVDYKTHHCDGFQVPDRHLSSFGETLIPGIGPGALTAVGRWLRNTGTGNVITDGHDWVSLTIQEVVT